MKSFLTLKSVEEVLALVRTFSTLDTEEIPLSEASGRWLAEDWYAPEDLPGFDRSTVDGWAVHARDVFGAQEGAPALLECVADLSMGKAPELYLEEGHAARILTGGMLPEGADCVVMVEHSRPVNDTLVELVRSSRHPVFAVRDFNINPEMLHNTFDISTDGYDFPPYADRLELSTPTDDKKTRNIAAIICSETLG